jgi:hypothetical protein
LQENPARALVWTAPTLAFGFFVLSAFFLSAAWLVSTLLATLMLAAAWLVSTLLAAGRTVILRVTTGRLLTTAAAADVFTTLLHTLISFSVVCHVNPPFDRCFENFGPSENDGLTCQVSSTFMPKENQSNCASPCGLNSISEHSNNTGEHKSRTTRRQSAESSRQEQLSELELFGVFCVICGQ